MAKKKAATKIQVDTCDIRRVRCGTHDHIDFEMRIDPHDVDGYPVRISANPGASGPAIGTVDEMLGYLRTLISELEAWKEKNPST